MQFLRIALKKLQGVTLSDAKCNPMISRIPRNLDQKVAIWSFNRTFKGLCYGLAYYWLVEQAHAFLQVNHQ